MRHHFFDIAFTPAVQAEQHRHGWRASYATVVDPVLDGEEADILSQREKDFIADLEARIARPLRASNHNLSPG